MSSTAWTAWLAVVAASFAVMEGIGLTNGDTTLSRYIYHATRKWGPLPVALGAAAGGIALAVHLWLQWPSE